MAESSRYSLTMPMRDHVITSGAHKVGPGNPSSALVAAALITMVLAFATSSAIADDAEYNGISANGEVAIFSTDEPLVPGDTDNQRDVYERSFDPVLKRYVTQEVSVGSTGGNDAQQAQYNGVSALGDDIFFSTREPLEPTDSDHQVDIYKRALDSGTTTLVSQGNSSCEAQGCENETFDASFVGLAPSGEKLFFVTDEKLLPLIDTDSSPDIYMREMPAAGDPRTVLISQAAPDCGSCGNEASTVSFNAVSSDGSTAVFSSDERLANPDEDRLQDVYVRDLDHETTRLASPPRLASCPEEVGCKAVYHGVSSTGSHVFFESSERISAEDDDKTQDIYDWSVGTGAVLASGGNAEINATYAGNTSDGSAVFFHTTEALDTVADTDTSRDVYERSGSTTTLISTGPTGGTGAFNATLRWVSPDGSGPGVLFTTSEALTPLDLDNAVDIYERDGSVTTLVSTGGSGGPDVLFAGASNDGSHVFFITSEALVAEDQDDSSDIYEHVGSTTTLISTGFGGGNGEFGAGLNGVSTDGSRAFFTTRESLTEGDQDEEVDVYEHSGSVTRLVSAENQARLGPAKPMLTATMPVSPGVSTTPSIKGQADQGAWVKLYNTEDCTGKPVGQGTSEQLSSSGLSVSVVAGSTTTFRATAEVGGLVSPCSSSSISYKQETPQSPAGAEPSSGGGTSTTPGISSSTGKGTSGKTGGTNVTYVTPKTVITFGPAAKTRKRKVIFRFTDATGQLGSSFLCRLDRHRWKGCSSPTRLAKLRRGRHTFSVKAVNAVGVADEQPTKRRFKVVR